jgi:nicotinamidase-related amidase
MTASPLTRAAAGSTVAGSEPYAWPWDGHLDPARAAVVVLGWDTAWASRCVLDAATTQRIHDLAAAVAFVVTVAHLPTSPRPGVGAAVAAEPLDPPVPGALAVTAGGIDGFHAGPLDGILRAAGRDQLLLCGHGLEGPVHSTMRSANDRGHECLLVLDACAPSDPALVAASRSMVLMSGGIFGAVGATEATLAALATTAQPPGAPGAPGGAA